MDHGTIALIIPIMALSIPFFAIWTKHQRRLAEMQMLAAPSQADTGFRAETVRRIEALEERIRVLERIATDRPDALAAEIEALRHPASLANGGIQPTPNGSYAR